MAEAGGSTDADRGEDAEHNNSMQFICLSAAGYKVLMSKRNEATAKYVQIK
jgi:hypothetical protein